MMGIKQVKSSLSGTRVRVHVTITIQTRSNTLLTRSTADNMPTVCCLFVWFTRRLLLIESFVREIMFKSFTFQINKDLVWVYVCMYVCVCVCVCVCVYMLLCVPVRLLAVIDVVVRGACQPVCV